MIDFQCSGLEYQVYELIAKMCKLLHSNEFPKFETKQVEDNKWHCTISIPGIKSRVTGEGETEVGSINVCAMGMMLILDRECGEKKFDPSVERSIFGPSVFEYFEDHNFDKEYVYRLISTDITIDSKDELCNALLKKYATSKAEQLLFKNEIIESMSKEITVRILVKERKENYC